MGVKEGFHCTFLVGDEVLDDDVGHVVPVGVAVFVQAVHRAEHQLVVRQGSILTPHHLETTSTPLYTHHVNPSINSLFTQLINVISCSYLYQSIDRKSQTMNKCDYFLMTTNQPPVDKINQSFPQQIRVISCSNQRHCLLT
eukprot:GHVL01029802.1.p1 GENE.GHVL01029802.1~~GHVL01029802.1.p1  ORF type:complete len:141 (+),score=12.37 GHVL01029802.1:206-628(+)